MPEGRLGRTRAAYLDETTQVIEEQVIRCCALCAETVLSETAREVGACRHVWARNVARARELLLENRQRLGVNPAGTGPIDPRDAAAYARKWGGEDVGA